MARIRDSTKVFGKSCCVPLPCSRVLLLFLYWMSHTVLQTASVLRLSIPVCHESHSLKCDCAGHAGPTSAKGSLKWAYETRVKCTNSPHESQSNWMLSSRTWQGPKNNRTLLKNCMFIKTGRPSSETYHFPNAAGNSRRDDYGLMTQENSLVYYLHFLRKLLLHLFLHSSPPFPISFFPLPWRNLPIHSVILLFVQIICASQLIFLCGICY